MASEQREKERLARKEQKNKKRRAVAWAVIGVIIAALLVMRIIETDFSSIGGDSESGTDESTDYLYQLASSSDLYFGAVGGNIAVLEDTSYTVIDSSSGDVEFTVDHGYSNPVAVISGSYSLLYDQGGVSYRLDKGSENIYEEKTSQTILCADVSSFGAVAVAQTDGDSLSTVSVYSKSLSQKLSYDVSGYVTNIAVDARGSRVAFAVVSSEDARLKTVVYTMSVNDTEPRAQFEYVGSSVLALHFSSTDLFVVGSDFLSVISSLKDSEDVFEQGTVNTVSYSFSSSGSLVYAYTEYSGSSDNIISVVKPSGKVTQITTVSSTVKDVSASSSRVSILTADSILTYKISNSNLLDTYQVDDSYSSIVQISSDVYARHLAAVECLTDEQE